MCGLYYVIPATFGAFFMPLLLPERCAFHEQVALLDGGHRALGRRRERVLLSFLRLIGPSRWPRAPGEQRPQSSESRAA